MITISRHSEVCPGNWVHYGVGNGPVGILLVSWVSELIEPVIIDRYLDMWKHPFMSTPLYHPDIQHDYNHDYER